ncbi:DUF4142 domain-containing protein [Pseudonocardiaceae bacterium YIM PH 21723]|nr:DUF4142 domain-containing protein [Pseudonocardiaceae bacterium YIM PH 21723]
MVQQRLRAATGFVACLVMLLATGCSSTSDASTQPAAAQSSASDGPGAPSETPNKFGPLGPVDKELLIRVWQAGLWEGPVSEWAQTQASSPRVKEVGAKLAADHKALNLQVEPMAKELGLELPDKPTEEQQGWMAQLKPMNGTEFDQNYATIVRLAHGVIFPIIAKVRSGTHNEWVRIFAQTGITVVMRHMTLLESTSDVDVEKIPRVTPAPPTSSGPPSQAAPPAPGHAAPGHQPTQQTITLPKAQSTSTVSPLVAGLLISLAVLAIVALLRRRPLLALATNRSRRDAGYLDN